MLDNEHVFRELPTGGLEFVGDFDRVYRLLHDPWGQSGTTPDMEAYYKLSRRKLLSVLRPYLSRSSMGKFKGLEVGCGHGHLTELLASIPGVGPDRRLVSPIWDGMDISEGAVRVARGLHPNAGITFFTGDLTNPGLVGEAEEYSVVVLGQVWWYILHDLHTALNNCVLMLRSGGLLVVSQAFLEEQRYGAVIANGFEGALEVFLRLPWQRKLRILEAHYDDQLPGQYRDGLIVLRKV